MDPVVTFRTTSRDELSRVAVIDRHEGIELLYEQRGAQIIERHVRWDAAFVGAAQQRGATKVFLTTGSGNVAARSLYDAIGGQIADQGDTTNYWWNLERSPQGVTRS